MNRILSKSDDLINIFTRLYIVLSCILTIQTDMLPLEGCVGFVLTCIGFGLRINNDLSLVYVHSFS